jgi:branched-chain amino acid transport system permease protein
MFLPIYRGWVIVASLAVCSRTWFVDRAHPARRLPARRDREPAPLVQAFGIDVPRMVTLTYGAGVGARRASPACWPRRSIR